MQELSSSSWWKESSDTKRSKSLITIRTVIDSGMAKIHLPPELRNKTIYLRDEIIVGRWLWSYGMFMDTQKPPQRTREVILKEERWAEKANCSVSDNAYFVMSTLDSSGLIEMQENYEYTGWNVGYDDPISNWYLSDSKAKADEVFEYLLFFSRLIDT